MTFGDLITLVILGLIVRAIYRWWQDRDLVDVANAEELQAMFKDVPGVRVMTRLPTWRDYLYLPAPVDGVITMAVPPSLPLQDVTAFVYWFKPAILQGHVLRLLQGNSGFLLEIGLAAQRAGLSVEGFAAHGFGKSGFVISRPLAPVGSAQR